MWEYKVANNASIVYFCVFVKEVLFPKSVNLVKTQQIITIRVCG